MDFFFFLKGAFEVTATEFKTNALYIEYAGIECETKILAMVPSLRSDNISTFITTIKFYTI